MSRSDAFEIVFGINAVETALRVRPEAVTDLWVNGERMDARMNALRGIADEVGVRVQHVGSKTLEKVSAGGMHQGAALRRKRRPNIDWAIAFKEIAAQLPPIIVALDGVMDPHNFGACIRSAAAVGAHTFLYPRSRGGSVTPTVRRVASGGSELLALQAVPNLSRALTQLGECGYQVLGLAGECDQPLFMHPVDSPVVLVAGTEQDGLRRLTREACTSLVRIPMASDLESLNVSVAVGVALFNIANRKGLL